jgi:hypothetical protein
MAHIPQILGALGIDRILTQYCSWRGSDPESGAQLDLVLYEKTTLDALQWGFRMTLTASAPGCN